MKRLILSAAVLLSMTGLAFAQPLAPAKTHMLSAQSMAGKLKTVSEADAAKGAKSEITVIGTDATAKAFLVKADTTIYDSNGKPLTLKDLKVDGLVKVNYKTSAEGVLVALAIYQTK